MEQREEFVVETIPVDREGFVDLAALSETLDDDVLLASVMAVNNEVGVIQDLPTSPRCWQDTARYSTATRRRRPALWM